MDDKRKKRSRHIYLCDSHVNSPCANSQIREPDSNVTIPSDEDVETAKAWVDFNEK